MRRSALAFAFVMSLTGCDARHAGNYNELGNTRLQAGDARGAVAAFAEAVKLQPGSGKYHFNLGLAYVKLHHYDEASIQFAEAVRLDPADIEASRHLTLTNTAIAERSLPNY